MIGNRPALLASQPVFLLELDYGGKVYLLSSEAIELESNHGSIYFDGGLLSDPELAFILPEMGFNPESYSVSVACFLSNLNVAKQILSGNRLEDVEAEISFIMVSPLQVPTYETRKQLIKGKVKQPVFGHPDQPVSYVEFSIESDLNLSSFYGLEIGTGARLSILELSTNLNTGSSPFSSKFSAGTTLLEISDINKGKQLPFVFGNAGSSYNENNQNETYPIAPAYVLFADSSAPYEIFLLVAPHAIKASHVRIFSNKGGSSFQEVLTWIRSGGQVFSYVQFDLQGSGITGRITEDNSIQYYIGFEKNFGGGFVSTTTKETLSGGGDLCMFALSRGNVSVDYASWNSIRSTLNNFKFAGYINNTEVSAIEFLENEIIPFLPISIVQGNEGLKPVLNALYLESPLITATITASEEFKPVTPIETLSDDNDIVNDFTLRYSNDMRVNRFNYSLRCSGEIKNLSRNTFTDINARKSFIKFGTRSRVRESMYIHDHETAAQVVSMIIKINSTASRVIEYETTSRFSFLEIGNVIVITDTFNHIESCKAQVIEVRYTTVSWKIRLRIYEDL